MILLGVDFGGTKIEAAVLEADGPGGRFLSRRRAANPGSYEAALAAVRDLVAEVETEAAAGRIGRIGVGIPGSVSPVSGLMRNANSTWLNGKPFGEDLARVLDRPVVLANDANCFALSEAMEVEAGTVFGAILGTGCGGGLVVDGKVLNGANGVAGEWGHNPLPWLEPSELPGRACWCGRMNCQEPWLSGTGFQLDYREATGRTLTGEAIARAADAGEPQAAAALDRYIGRLGRGLAAVVNLFDPGHIVLGGGMSNIRALYGEQLREAVAAHAFTDAFVTPIAPPVHGDSSGVRGAAWLSARP